MLNRVALVGRLTKDPEMKYTPNSQTAVARLFIAVGRNFKKDGQPDADFIPIVVFGKQAENVGKYMRKGRLVAIAGRLQTRNWDDQQGKRHFTMEVIADEVDFLDKGNDSKGNEADNNYSNYSEDFHPVDENDDLPF